MRRFAACAAALAVGVVGVVTSTPARAAVVANTASTSYTGQGFDIFTAQPSSTMRAWLGSRYRAVGIYVGGVNRFDPKQPNLTPSWVGVVASAGYRFIPTYVGLQAPCTTSNKKHLITASAAATQGRSNAEDAVTQMRALGFGPGNPVYFDMEPFDATKAGCVKAVSAFFDGWTERLHRDGYRSGIYGSRNSTVKLLVAQYPNRAHQRPDDIWYAAYDGRDTTTGEPTIPSAYWVHHRIHQYTGGSSETWNGISLGIDRDAVDADVADPAMPTPPPGPPYGYAVSGTQGTPGLKERTAPSTTTGAVVATWPESSPLQVTCQTTGESVSGDAVWDQLPDGDYVSDLYTTTGGGLSWAGAVPRCDAIPAGHVVAPRNGVTVEAGRATTLAGWFAGSPAAIAAVTFQVSADGGATWTAAGTDAHGGNGRYSVVWPAAWMHGATALVQASVIDAAGATSVTDRVTGVRIVDTTAPRVRLAALPPATTAASMRWSWIGSDAGSGVRSYDVRYQRASYAGGFGAWRTRAGWTATAATARSLPLAAAYDYCVEVRARDNVGNLGPWSSRRCVARALDDRALAAATGDWSRQRGPDFYFGTVTSTTRASQSLTRTGARLVRIGVVATTCARCGTVAVYVVGHRVGRVSLYSPRPLRRQLLLLPPLRYRTGTVRVTTLTAGKTVQIDGLVISRT